ncbi:MAG: alpha/beta fold hydrolase [Coleofasciculaceae cyanobacterium SM2_3_26]|nr:alpha/beta fold hydrolase [Coleofasciculaceae cyanobacterium SM2_3_26]
MNPIGAIAGWCLSLLLLVAGFALGHTYQPLEVIVEAVSIPMGTSGQLAGRVFLPARILPPYPVVVLCHGVSSTKEVMTPIATELARQGMAGFAFDFGGFGESYDRPIDDQANLVNLADIQAVVRFIRDRPERFDSRRLGIVGHSMGGAAALLFAEVDADLRQRRYWA